MAEWNHDNLHLVCILRVFRFDGELASASSDGASFFVLLFDENEEKNVFFPSSSSR